MFGKDSEAGRGEGKFYSEKREGFSVCWLKAVLLGRLGAGQLGVGHPRGLVWEHIWLSFIGPELEEKAKMKEAGIIDQVLPGLNWLLPSLWFGLPVWVFKWYSWSGHRPFMYSVSHVIQVSADCLSWLCLHLDVVKTGRASQQPAPLLCTNSRGLPWPWTFFLTATHSGSPVAWLSQHWLSVTRRSYGLILWIPLIKSLLDQSFYINLTSFPQWPHPCQHNLLVPPQVSPWGGPMYACFSSHSLPHLHIVCS